MRFRYVAWKNLLSTGNAWTRFELDTVGSMTLVVGRNGDGKSTLIDALVFGLFGVPYRRVKKGQLVNSVNGRETEVEVAFEKSGHEYVVRRGIKPDVFEVRRDGTLLHQDGTRDQYQETLEGILGWSLKTAQQVVALGVGSVSFMRMTAGMRRSFVEDLLDIGFCTRMSAALKRRQADTQAAVQEARTRKTQIETTIELLSERVRRSKRDTAAILDEKRSRLADAVGRLETLVAEVGAREDALRGTVRTDTSRSRKTLTSYIDTQGKLRQRLDTVKRELEFFAHNETCPTCRQSIDADFRAAAVGERESLGDELTTALGRLAGMRSEIELSISAAEDTNRREDAARSELMATMRSVEAARTRVRELEADVELTERTSVEVIDEAEIERARTELIDIETTLARLSAEADVHREAATLLKDDGVRAAVVRAYIPTINARIRDYLDAMNFHVDFELDSEFEETIRSRYRDEFSYDSFSEGEKKRIDLAVTLAWRAIARQMNAVDTGLLVMDEVLDSALDSGGMDDLVSIVRGLSRDCAVVVISHKDQMYDRFDRVVRFEKRGLFSSMVE